MSLSLTNTGTTNGSSQGYHSISTSSTLTNMENINKENFRTPLSFKNPLYNLKDESQHIYSDLSDDEDNNKSDLSNQLQTDSSKPLYFINNLSIESMKSPSSQQTLAHSTSRESLQQPLFLLNNCYAKGSTQSLASSNIDTPLTTTNYKSKTDEKLNRRQASISSQQLPPKMGLKALNHTSANKVIILLE
jgi:hypothetical protein